MKPTSYSLENKIDCSYQENLLKTIAAVSGLLQSADYEQAMEQGLSIIGKVMDAYHMYVFEHEPGQQGELFHLNFWWAKYPDTMPNTELIQDGRIDTQDVMPMLKALQQGNTYCRACHKMTEARHTVTKMFGDKSILVVPVFVDHELWGSIAISDDNGERIWTGSEEAVLCTMATNFGAALKRKGIDRQLRKFSQAVEQSPSTVVITDTHGVIEYVNAKFTATTGYSKEEALGQKPSVLKSGEQPPEVYEELWRTIAGGAEWRGEFHNKRKDGELYWESASISPLRNLRGEIRSYLALKEDITARKKAEDLLQQEKEFVENLLDNAAIPTFVIDNQHKVLIWNKACEQLTGIKAEAVLGTDQHGRIFFGDSQPCYADHVIDGGCNTVCEFGQQCTTALHTAEGLRGEGWYGGPNGLRYVVHSAAPIHNHKGQLIAAIEMVQDITDRKRAEEALERDMRLGAKIQRGFLPPEYCDERIAIRSLYLPHRHVSGDLYDYVWLSGKKRLFGYLADVMGHGLSTALQTSALRVLFRQMAETDMCLAHKLHWINQEVVPYTAEDSFVAAICFELDLERRTLTYASGGINYFLASNQQLPRVVRMPGSFVGILRDAEYEQRTVSVAQGDTFYFMSDGLFDLIGTDSSLPLRDFEETLQNFVDVEKQKPTDDISALCIQVK